MTTAVGGSPEARAPFIRDHGPDAARQPDRLRERWMRRPEFTIRARGAAAAAAARRYVRETPSTRPRPPSTRDGPTRARRRRDPESTQRHRRQHTLSPLKNAGGFLSLTGLKSSETLLGRNCGFLQGPRTDARAVAKIRDAIKSGRDVQIVLLNYKIDSTTFWNHFFIASRCVDDKGDGHNFLGSRSRSRSAWPWASSRTPRARPNNRRRARPSRPRRRRRRRSWLRRGHPARARRDAHSILPVPEKNRRYLCFPPF